MFEAADCRKSLILFVIFALMPMTAAAQGIFLQAGGSVNRGMGGATTGTAIDSIGSMFWNPATISQLPTNELAFGFEAIYKSPLEAGKRIHGGGQVWDRQTVSS